MSVLRLICIWIARDEMNDLKNYARNVQVLSNIYQESMYVYDIYADIDIKVDQFRNGFISKNEFLIAAESKYEPNFLF